MINFYVHRNLIMMMIDKIKVLPCVPIQIKQTNISIFSPVFGLTVFFMQTHFDSLCTAIEAHKKDAMTNLAFLH